MKPSGRVIAGIIALILAAGSAVGGILYYLGHHTLRGLVLLIACGILLVVGVVLLVLSRRQLSS